ncbi:MAG: ABC transporter ATP-binding protein [Blautia sp.]|nr:ABC transporter ATP-binding protein [Blautia sp.]
MNKPILTINNISASYDHVPVLRNVSLDIPQGHILGLVGESGSGKSTMARVITGLLRPEGGSIAFEGKTLGSRRSREQRRGIQMVFQNPEGSLNPRLRIGKTICDGIRFHGLADKSEAERITERLLAELELPADSAGRYPAAFSGGQKQRIALARALAVQPRLLIADEPTSALDVRVQLKMLELLLKLKRERNLTVLFISHDMGVIRYLCDDVAVMKQGELVETAPAEEFFRHPATAYGRELLESVPKMRKNL